MSQCRSWVESYDPFSSSSTSLTFQLRVVVGVSQIFKVSSQDRVHQPCVGGPHANTPTRPRPQTRPTTHGNSAVRDDSYVLWRRSKGTPNCCWEWDCNFHEGRGRCHPKLRRVLQLVPPSFLALAILCPHAVVWCCNSAKAIATLRHSCRSHCLCRRCRLLAAPVSLAARSAANTKAQNR